MTAFDKSFEFAVEIVGETKRLTSNRHFELARQLLRSGTSIGANLAEAQYAQSSPDFLSKLSIALKEAAETRYWLKLLTETGDIENETSSHLIENADEIIRMLTASIKTTKKI